MRNGAFRPSPARAAVAYTGQVGSVVLVVEDERDIRELVRRYLERAGYSVLTTGSGAAAVRILHEHSVQLVVLDLGLPDVDGTEVLRTARADSQVPVVVLTARTAVDDRINGLRLGADDYVTKPFSPTELVLRVGAVLHRTLGGETDPGVSSYGDGRLVIDTSRHEVRWDGALLDLTPTEWGVLQALAAVPGRVYSRYELVNRVRGYEFSGYERTIDSHVKNLRHKLGDDGSTVIRTVQGAGYRLELVRDH